MVDHACAANHVGLPWAVHLRIVVRSTRDSRTDDVAAVILHSLDESGNTGWGVILDVGSIVARIAGPEEVAERNATLEYLECAVGSVE